MTRSRSKCPDNNPYGKFDLDMSTRLDLGSLLDALVPSGPFAEQGASV